MFAVSTPSWNEILVVVGFGALSVIIFVALMVVALKFAEWILTGIR
jgi:Ni/Fe-hydrogenase subunit HybB-like protein